MRMWTYNYSQPYCPDGLYHHGIKGMRWGIRRYQNKDGTLTPEGKQRLAEKGIRTEENLSDKIIPKGTKMYRVTAYEKDTTETASKYVSYIDVDRKLYKSGMDIKRYAGKDPKSDVYEHEFELKEDLNVPSLTTVRQVEKQVLANKARKQEVGKAYVETLMSAYGSVPIKEISTIANIANQMEKASKSEVKLKQLYSDLAKKYGNFMAQIYIDNASQYNESVKMMSNVSDLLTVEQSLGRAANTKSDIIKELQKRGYNAMYDNASIGVPSDGKYSKHQEGVEPLIIFDAEKSLDEIKVNKVSYAEQKKSDKDYLEWLKDRDKTLKGFK